jgi:hypothetical protein
MNNENLNHAQQNNNEDEIDLSQFFKLLKERMLFIFSLTAVLTLLSLLFIMSLKNIPTKYNIQTSFISPDMASVKSLNNFPHLNVSAESIFHKFLDKVNSKVLQEEIFIKGNYFNKLSNKYEITIDKDTYISNLINRVSLEYNQSKTYELPTTLSVEGLDSAILSDFINETVVKANNQTVNDYIHLEELTISQRLNEIALQKEILLFKMKKDRQSEIEQIKEQDAEAIRVIKDKISSAKEQGKLARLNEIERLTNDALLAKNLGIVENNFDSVLGRVSLPIIDNTNRKEKDNPSEVNYSLNIPDWYLLGEKALLEKIKLLKTRTNDESFLPELLELNSQLNRKQNNNLLKTLEKRKDDSLFSPQMNRLEVEKIKLNSIKLNSTGINSMQLVQAASSTILPNKNFQKKVTLLVLGFFGSFVLSICLALLMNHFKEGKTNELSS